MNRLGSYFLMGCVLALLVSSCTGLGEASWQADLLPGKNNNPPDPKQDWVPPNRPFPRDPDLLFLQWEKAATRVVDHVADRVSTIVYMDGVWRGVMMTLVAELIGAVVAVVLHIYRRA